jgi:uncharacterized protein YndB with AHSA1/START domain
MNHSEKQVHLIHFFKSTIAQVFQAWTNPEMLKNWYVPSGCKIIFKQINITVGGKIHSCIDNPEYGKCWCMSEYLEIIPNEKLVFTMENTDEDGNTIEVGSNGMDSNWPTKTIVTILFSKENGMTKLELFQTVDAELAKKTGAYNGWLQMFDNLLKILSNENNK